MLLDGRIFVTKTDVFIPTRLDWMAMLIMIGIFGFIAQVSGINEIMGVSDIVTDAPV